MKVVITRAQNGWILEEEAALEYDEGTYIHQEVFEDEEHPDENYAQASSLANLLWSVFQIYYQTKWRGGIRLEVMETGRERELDELLEDKYHDFGEPCELGESPFESGE